MPQTVEYRVQNPGGKPARQTFVRIGYDLRRCRDDLGYQSVSVAGQAQLLGKQLEVARLNVALAQLRLQLQTEEARSEELDAKVNALQRSVNRMSALLVEHDIPIPAVS